jgi:hypothetical protein
MNTMKPLKLGMKYGAMKVKKGGCMTCGNMQHTGCMCHMLGAGVKRIKKAGELPNYLENLMKAYEDQDNKPDKYTGKTMEELAQMTPEERRKIKKEAEKQRGKERRGGAPREKSKLLRDKFGSLYEKQQDYKRAEDERLKKLTEPEEDWLDKAFDWATDKLIDYGSKAIGSVIPVKGVEDVAKTGLKALQKGLKGGQMSQKQKEYQQALELIKKKYNVNHKQAMVKYKMLKNNL